MLFIVSVITLSIIADLGFIEPHAFILIVLMFFEGLSIFKKPLKSVLPGKQLFVFLIRKYKPLAQIRSAKMPVVKIVGILRVPFGYCPL